MTQFKSGDIVRLHLDPSNSFRNKTAGYDAILTRQDKNTFGVGSEKWHFRMMDGPLVEKGDYYCIDARYLTLRPLPQTPKPPTKGLPEL